jgi:nicotinate-nucleotide pyrophosphorylase (carboxylating)
MKHNAEVIKNVKLALSEDVLHGDLTAQLTPDIPDSEAVIICRNHAILCGQDWFNQCFLELNSAIKINWHAKDGDKIKPGAIICNIVGSSRSILKAERSALNFLQLLSGVATKTQEYVDCIAGTKAKILDTRKTIPGLRYAQKYAVSVGGGVNHRMGLWDAILIKENHISAAGGITPALKKAQSFSSKAKWIQIEVENIDQLKEAIDAGAKMILLDNMSLSDIQQAVVLNENRAVLEASGGITLPKIRAIAETGVHRISIGTLTKDILSVDLSLRFLNYKNN